MTDSFDVYVAGKRDQIHLAEHLQRMNANLFRLNDNRLRIDNNTGIYPSPTSISYLAEHQPELASDPAFMKLKRIYDSLKKFRYQEDYPLSPIKGLNRLATKIVNRELTQNDYEDILESRLTCVYEAEQRANFHESSQIHAH